MVDEEKTIIDSLIAMYKNLLIHTLALSGPVKNADDLKKIAETAVSLGAAGIELLFRPLQDMYPRVIAETLRSAGCKGASLCVAQLGGETGDPLIKGLREPAAWLVKDAIVHVADMRDEGLDIDLVDGPWACVLGKQDYPKGAMDEVVEFIKHIAGVAERAKVRLALERLQPSEDGVIRTMSRLKEVVDRVGSEYVGIHEDTFHCMRNHEIPADAIEMAGKRLFHFHANGTGSNQNHGRIPCGCCEYSIGGTKYTDVVGWATVSSALGITETAPLVCIEPFSEEACVAIPPLRTGVVPITHLDQLRESIKNLAAAGILTKV